MGLSTYFPSLANTWAKLQTFTLGIKDSTLTASKVVLTDSSKQLVSSTLGISDIAQLTGAQTLDGKTLTNIVRIQNALGTALETTGTIDLDFSTNELVLMPAMTGNVTFTASSYAIGRTKTIRIIGGASAYTFTFPSGWIFLNNSKPTSLAIGKYAVLTITSFGTIEGDCIASYGVQT